MDTVPAPSSPRVTASQSAGGSGVDGVSAEPSYSAWMLEEMRRREWRQADFARAVGVDVSMVSRWLQGRRPDPGSLERVASALGVDLDALLTLAGHRPRSPRDDDPGVAAASPPQGVKEKKVGDGRSVIDYQLSVSTRPYRHPDFSTSRLLDSHNA